ncbi:MAG: polymerase sigma-70 factor, subfamily [Pseudonocardiales bacterium]|jgi:RNA polymerase sigma-70 factor (ECF subfamily)|nr:polymerase sigma-70 factor, subfamily [Pseudonocardiales bacterium]
MTRILPRVIGEGFGVVLKAAQTGDSDAFATLWRDTNPLLLRYLRLLDPSAAEDLAAETWLNVVRGLRKFEGDELAWRGWMFTIARRPVVDEIRRKIRQPADPLAWRYDGGSVAEDSADVALRNLDTRAALELVATLPPLQAEVIVLRVVAGLPVDIVAKIVNRSAGAVRVAAHRGLRTLAGVLSEKGVTL